MKKLMIIPMLLCINTLVFANSKTIQIVKPVANITDTIPTSMADTSTMMSDSSRGGKMKSKNWNNGSKSKDKTKNKMNSDTTGVKKDY